MCTHIIRTVNVADHEVSPLSDEAVQVYRPESLSCKSYVKNKNKKNRKTKTHKE